MGKIDFTNIVIDDFSLARNSPRAQLIHILTHIHTGIVPFTQVTFSISRYFLYYLDHLKGLSDTWDYGTIYCTTVTKDLLLLRYPSLAPMVQTLPLEQP